MVMVAAAEPQFHVLAVDDSLIDRKLIERLLKTSSYQVTTVDSGSKALEFLGIHVEDEESNPNQPSVSPNTQQEEQFQDSISPRHKQVEVNLIITDYCMPEMTGYDLLKKIKESSSLRNIPVVIMSSEYDKLRINRCLEEGAKEFFLKPVQLIDVHKLRSYMMKAKQGDQNHHETQSKSQQQLRLEAQGIELRQPPQLHQPQQLMHMLQNDNKRKNMDGALSPDRTRPRYNGIIWSEINRNFLLQ